jgi:hypothetical protein
LDKFYFDWQVLEDSTEFLAAFPRHRHLDKEQEILYCHDFEFFGRLDLERVYYIIHLIISYFYFIFFRAIACEREHVVLQCPNNLRVNILSSNYGRTNTKLCCPVNVKCDTKTCVSDFYEDTSEQCNLLSTCVLHASNHLYGDPCPGVNKYLEVYYTCE